MTTESNNPASSARDSSPNASTVAVGIIAVAALAAAVYAIIKSHSSRAPAADPSSLNIHFDALDGKLASLDQRLGSLEQQSSGASAQGDALNNKLAGFEKRLDALERERAAASAPAAATSATAAPAQVPSDVPSESTTPQLASSSATMALPAASADGVISGNGAFDIVANPALKGRLGRIVVAFPAGTKELKARTGISKSGETKEVGAYYGDAAVEMVPGIYDVEIGGRKIAGVVVQARSDTRMHVGVLHLNGSSGTRFGLFVPGEKKEMQAAYGENNLGLPTGDYEVEVNSQRAPVTIANGGTTEF